MEGRKTKGMRGKNEKEEGGSDGKGAVIDASMGVELVDGSKLAS